MLSGLFPGSLWHGFCLAFRGQDDTPPRDDLGALATISDGQRDLDLPYATEAP